MSTPSGASAETFEAMYQIDRDPWNFAYDPYERSRYEAVVAALPAGRFEFGFEPGCSVGELAALVAPRCNRYLAIDIAPTAVATARARCRHLPHVEVQTAALPVAIPTRGVDLLVFSEIGYYFDEPALASIIEQLRDRLVGRAVVVACHWLGSSGDHVLSGDRVHELLNDTLGTPTNGWRARDYRIDLWTST